jgi:hypothetical protein
MDSFSRRFSLAFAPLGCKTAPITNAIVSRADNPNGETSALLVQRYRRAALTSDGFYLLIVSKNQDVSKAINNEAIHNSSALVATSAKLVQLHWQDRGTLIISCASCGLQAVDITKKLNHVGPFRIIYEGFPKHTAYS